MASFQELLEFMADSQGDRVASAFSASALPSVNMEDSCEVFDERDEWVDLVPIFSNGNVNNLVDDNDIIVLGNNNGVINCEDGMNGINLFDDDGEEINEAIKRMCEVYVDGLELNPNRVELRKRQRGGRVAFSLPEFNVLLLSSPTRRVVSSFNRVYFDAEYLISHNFIDVDLLGVGKAVDKMFASFIFPILEDPVNNVNGSDIISITIKHQDLRDIYMYSRVNGFRIEGIVDRLFQCSQSNTAFLLDGKFKFEISLTRPGRGGARLSRRKLAPRTAFENDARKTSILQIKNSEVDGSENACGYWAVVCAKFRFENRRKVENLKQDKNLSSVVKGARIKLLDNEWWNVRSRQYLHLASKARVLCEQVGLDYLVKLDSDGLKRVDAWLKPEFQLYVVDGENIGKKIYAGEDAPDQLYIVLREGHYNVIGSIKGYYGRNHFGHKCWQGYDHPENHICKHACPQCQQKKNCESLCSDKIVCDECNRFFFGAQCLKQHLDNKICKAMKKCSECEVEYFGRHPHECGKVFCWKCKKQSESPHHCYIMPKNFDKLEKEDEKLKFIVSFDIESELRKEGKKQVHLPNLLIAQIACDECYDHSASKKKCIICRKCGIGERIYKGYDCVKEFGNDLYGEIAFKAEALKARVFVFAHNFKGYDGHFIFKDLFWRVFEEKPHAIMSGSKILKIDIGNIRFIDSLSFFQQPLAALPKSFGFMDRVVKGYFPHKFNSKENWDYEGSWPEASYYGPEHMKVGDQSKFFEWHEQQQSKVFNLQAELIKYCQNDVEILMLAVMKFKNEFKKISKIDPLSRNFTLASIGMEIYRALFLPGVEESEGSIGITPIANYSKRNSSRQGDVWLDWIEKENNIKLDREVKVGPYYADGKLENIVYEFNGCPFHGCIKCYPDNRDDFIEFVSVEKSVNKLYEVYQEKKAYYQRQNLVLVEKWGCEYDEEKKNCARFREFEKKRVAHYKKLKAVGGACIRESFFGGRTNNLKFWHEAEEEEEIRYFDVTSEYPYVLKNFFYPVGHPKVIREGFEDLELNNIFGFIKCRILPPKQLYLPVLPARVNERLEFVLCNACAQSSNQGTCMHSDHERCLIGTWPSSEVQKAVSLGYEIIEFFEVLHYEEKSDALFKEYVNMWLKEKQEASGWMGYESDGDKLAYIAEYESKEGIRLDYDKIEINPGRRFIAKLMLNSFWGKLSQRPNLPQIKICQDANDVWSLLSDESIKVTGEQMVNDETLLMCFEKREIEECDPGNTSVAIASFVTSYARLYLYSFMEKILQNGEDRLLYFDTDSLIYIEKRDDEVKLQLGDFLGDLTSELADYGPGAKISKFVSGGPKNYGYEVVKSDGSTRAVIKAKGISQNASTLSIVNLKRMEEFARKYVDGIPDEVQVPQLRFSADKFSQKVESEDVLKVYRVVSKKRRVLGNRTLPFGYVDQIIEQNGENIRRL